MIKENYNYLITVFNYSEVEIYKFIIRTRIFLSHNKLINLIYLLMLNVL